MYGGQGTPKQPTQRPGKPKYVYHGGMWVKVPGVKPRVAPPPRSTVVTPRTTVRPAAPAPARPRPSSPPPRASGGGGRGRVSRPQREAPRMGPGVEDEARVEEQARRYAREQAQARLRQMARGEQIVSEHTPSRPYRPSREQIMAEDPGRLAVRGSGTVGRNYARGAELRGGPGRYQAQFFMANYSYPKKLRQPGRVEALQHTLRHAGYDIGIDGKWGAQTAKAYLDYANELGQSQAADYMNRSMGAPTGERGFGSADKRYKAAYQAAVEADRRQRQAEDDAAIRQSMGTRQQAIEGRRAAQQRAWAERGMPMPTPDQRGMPANYGISPYPGINPEDRQMLERARLHAARPGEIGSFVFDQAVEIGKTIEANAAMYGASVAAAMAAPLALPIAAALGSSSEVRGALLGAIKNPIVRQQTDQALGGSVGVTPGAVYRDITDPSWGRTTKDVAFLGLAVLGTGAISKSARAADSILSRGIDAAAYSRVGRKVRMPVAVKAALESRDARRAARALRKLNKDIEPYRTELDLTPARKQFIEEASKAPNISERDVETAVAAYDWHAVQIAKTKGIPVSEAWKEIVSETHFREIGPTAAEAGVYFQTDHPELGDLPDTANMGPHDWRAAAQRILDKRWPNAKGKLTIKVTPPPGFENVDDLARLLEENFHRALRGRDSRDWYRQAAGRILKHTKGAQEGAREAAVKL